MIIPLNNRVIVKRTKIQDTSAGGIILPDAEKDKPNTGTVIASASNELEVGDTVLFGTYAGAEMKLGAESVLIMKYEDIIAKIKS